MFSIRKALGVSGVVGLMAVTAAPALAQKTTPTAPTAPTSPQSVTVATFSNPTNAQSFGSVQCPTGSLRTGGGVYGFGGLAQSINSTYPSGNGWAAYVNNTGSATSFYVYAVCLS